MALRDKVKPIYSGKDLYSFMDKRDKYDAKALKKIAPTAVFKYDRGTPLHLNVSSDFQRSLRDKLLHAEDIGELYKGTTINEEGTGTLENTNRKSYMMGNMAQASLLKKGRLKDHYQNKFSLGIAPRYNPIGYIGRGYGAWKGRGERSLPDKYRELLGGKANVGKVTDPELSAVRYTEDMKDDEYIKAMKARGALYKNKKGNYEDIAREDIKHTLRYQSNFTLTPVVKKHSDALKKNPITNVLNNGLGKLLKNKDNYQSYDFGLEKGFKEAVKKVTKKQSLTDSLLLPSVGASVGAGKAIYENNYGSMKDMPRLNKRYNLIGSTLTGIGAGQAIANTNTISRGFSLAGGIMGMEVARRAKYGPRLEDPVAGDGSSTVAAVNGSGL